MGIGHFGPFGRCFQHVPRDRNFWWASSRLISTPPYTGKTEADGFHFTGKMSYDGGSLLKKHFGVVSRYKIDAERIPRPRQGPWLSAPRFEHRGRLYGST